MMAMPSSIKYPIRPNIGSTSTSARVSSSYPGAPPSLSSMGMSRKSEPMDTGSHVRRGRKTPRRLRMMRYTSSMCSMGAGELFLRRISVCERRAFEEGIIRKWDRLAINQNVGEFWFLIDAVWMKEWVDFVVGNADAPGPVSNLNLFDKVDEDCITVDEAESQQVKRGLDIWGRGPLAKRPDLSFKKDLEILRDYRAVHPLIWYIFCGIYERDDAPEICRWGTDIYTEGVQPFRKNRIRQKFQPKAEHEVKKMVERVKAKFKQK